MGDAVKRPGRRAAILAWILGAQAAFYVGLQIGARHPIKRPTLRTVSPTVRWRRERTETARELALGSRSPGAASLGVTPGKAAAVVFLGDRDDCGTRSLMAAWREAAEKREDVTVLFVTRRFDSGLRLPCEGKGPRPRIVEDPSGETARRFNATWTPRSYGLDPEGRIAYVQPATTTDTLAPADTLAALTKG